MSTMSKKRVFLIILFIIFILVLICGTYFFNHIRTHSKYSENKFQLSYYKEKLVLFNEVCSEFPISMDAIKNGKYNDCIKGTEFNLLPDSIESNNLIYVKTSNYVLLIPKDSDLKFLIMENKNVQD